MQYPIIDLITDAYLNNGWTGLDVSIGKNMLDPLYRTVTTQNIRYYRNEPLLLESGTYTLSCSNAANGLYVNDSDGSIFTKYNSTFLTFTLTESKLVDFNFYFANGADPTALCQLEVGSVATPYEPYSEPKNDFPNRLKLPLPHYFPYPVIDALQRAAAGTQTADDTEILRHYLTPLGIGGI